jgi:hypothetical protein
MDESVRATPAPEEIRAQVDRMIASSEFTRSPQLGALLRFLVEAVLQGKSNRIKAYTIGVEVLRRDSKFDPQIDPIVRVKATRLRRTIDRYYAGPGAGDAIRIAIPRGSYVPTFSPRVIAPGEAHFIDRWAPIRPLFAGAVALVVVIIVVIAAAAVLYRSEPVQKPPAQESQATTQSQHATASLPPGNGMPNVFMPAFEVRGSPGPRSISAKSLHDSLSDAFAHFDLINILLEPGNAQPAGAEAATALNANAEYRFTGSVEYADDGAARLLFRLLDLSDGSIVWSRAFDRVPADGNQASAEEKIVRLLAGTLLQPFGVIYAHQRKKVLAGTPTDPRYRCLVVVIDSFASFDPPQHARGRDCLEQLTAHDPNFALAFTYLAAMDLREFQYGSGGAPLLEHGLIAARRGVELQPESSRAYEMLFVILFARRDLAAAFDAANKAIALNKYDTRSLGAYGARLIATGEFDRGLAMLQQAGDDGTVRPPFEEFFVFLADYLRGDLKDAEFHADQLTGNDFQLGLIARALADAARGDRDATRRALDQLVALNLAWRDDLRGTLARFFYAPAVIDRLAQALASAGLSDHH